MAAGYSGTPLVRKLGIKDGFKVLAVSPPSHYWALLGPMPDGVERAGPRARGIDFVHVFSESAADLRRRLPGLTRRIVSNGMIWVSWPKKASKVPTDLTEDVVRALALPLGLVDVKVCAVDDVWSGLKLVIRRENR